MVTDNAAAVIAALSDVFASLERHRGLMDHERQALEAALTALRQGQADTTAKIAIAELAGYSDGVEGLPANAYPSAGNVRDAMLAYELWFRKGREIRTQFCDTVNTAEAERDAARRDHERALSALDTVEAERAVLVREVTDRTEERDAARMGLFSHLTGEHYLAQPTYAQLTEQLDAARRQVAQMSELLQRYLADHIHPLSNGCDCGICEEALKVLALLPAPEVP